MRIVSLLPSATEILFALGLGDQVVGVTFECDFPDEARTRQIVSNTTMDQHLTPAQIDAQVRARLAAGEDLYTLDEGALRHLDPDLIVTQDLCAVCAVDIAEVDEALEHLGCHADVVTLDPMTLDEVLDSIATVGRVTRTDERASALIDSLRLRLDQVAARTAGAPRPRMAVLEWTDPLFAPGHWVPDLVTAAGATSVIGRRGERSTQMAWLALATSEPEVIVVAPCGFRLEGATTLAQQLVSSGHLPDHVPVWAVDADAAFVRPGPRLVEGVETLAAIAHPALCAAPPNQSVRVR